MLPTSIPGVDLLVTSETAASVPCLEHYSPLFIAVYSEPDGVWPTPRVWGEDPAWNDQLARSGFIPAAHQ